MRFISELVLLLLYVVVPATAGSLIIAVDIQAAVHPITVEILNNSMERCRREKADLLLIRLNTPGGMIEATRIPVVTFVTPSGGRAASAGFFLLAAGDVAAMAYGTNTGAASPVLMGAEMDAVMRGQAPRRRCAFLN